MVLLFSKNLPSTSFLPFSSCSSLVLSYFLLSSAFLDFCSASVSFSFSDLDFFSHYSEPLLALISASFSFLSVESAAVFSSCSLLLRLASALLPASCCLVSSPNFDSTSFWLFASSSAFLANYLFSSSAFFSLLSASVNLSLMDLSHFSAAVTCATALFSASFSFFSSSSALLFSSCSLLLNSLTVFSSFSCFLVSSLSLASDSLSFFSSY